MERVVEKGGILGIFLPAVIVVLIGVLMVVIAYGVESVIPGVHDLFHDFRHVLGMPCH